MQRAVERDDQNRSNYAISAVDPSYISATFNDIALHEVIDSIGHKTGLLLEVVNFNVEVSTSSTSLFALELIILRVNSTFVMESLPLCRR